MAIFDLFVCVFLHAYMDESVCLCVYLFMYVCMPVYAHMYVYVVCVWMRVVACVCVCVCVCAHLEQITRGKMEGPGRNVYTLSSLHLKPAKDQYKNQIKKRTQGSSDTTLRLLSAQTPSP